MSTVITVFGDRIDFNHNNALIIYSIANIVKYHGFRSIIISMEDVPTYNFVDKIRVISYISSIPNVIIEKWIRSTDISIIVSELLHETSINSIICYGISCLLAVVPIKKIIRETKIIYSPSLDDLTVIESSNKLLSEAYTSLIRYALNYVDGVFDYDLAIKRNIDDWESLNIRLITDPESLRDIVFE